MMDKIMQVPFFLNGKFYQEITLDVYKYPSYDLNLMIRSPNYMDGSYIKTFKFRIEKFVFDDIELFIGICTDMDYYVNRDNFIERNRRKEDRRLQ